MSRRLGDPADKGALCGTEGSGDGQVEHRHQARLRLEDPGNGVDEAGDGRHVARYPPRE